MKKSISLILCLTLLFTVMQVLLVNNTFAANNDNGVMASGATASDENVTAGNGKGTASNVFTVDAVNAFDSSAKVILVYTNPLQNFYNQYSASGFNYSDYADVRVEYRSGRYAVLQKHYESKSDTGLQVDDGFILLVKKGTDQHEYIKSDVIADWKIGTDGTFYSDIVSDYNGDTVTLNLNSGIDYKTYQGTGGCGTVSFTHLDNGIMLGESSFQIDTINPTYIEHFNKASVIAIHPYYYTKVFENNLISFADVINKIGSLDTSITTLDQKLAAIKNQGFSFIRVEKRNGVYVALQKATDISTLSDADVKNFAVQNQDGFFVLARHETYEYNYVRDKLYVSWDSSAGTSALPDGDLMNINEYITPSINNYSLLYCGTGDAAGNWYGCDYNSTSGATVDQGTVAKNNRPYAYFNFFINNVVIPSETNRHQNELKNTDLNVVDNTNIKFQMFDYGLGINDKLRELGIVDYFSFKGVGQPYNYLYDDDGFTKNHASVERTLKNNFPVLNLTHSADGGAKRDADGTLATDTYPLDEATRTNFGYLFGSTLSLQNVNVNGTDGDGEYLTQYRVDNTLLQKNGNHYSYDSAKNAVNLNGREHKFSVRNYTERTNMTAGINMGYETKFSDFLPFSNTEGFVKGTAFTQDTKNINKYQTYQLDSTADFEQYWFGMRMDFNFVQDKNGKLVKDSSGELEDMIFKFSGDDDVWVFIDDVLVLDLGGTHGKVTGSINFATGEVRQYIDWVGGTETQGNAHTAEYSENGNKLTENSFPTTLYDCFDNAGRADSLLWKNSVSGNGKKVFSDYSQHTLSFFYLERGAGCSNCAMDFALTTVTNDKAVAISKEVYDSNNDRASESSTEYEFKVTDENGNLLTGTEAIYTIGSQSYTLGSDGIFKLKNGETALFSNWSANGTYKIVELDRSFVSTTESSIEGTAASGDNASGKTVTVRPVDDVTKYVRYVSTLKPVSLTVESVIQCTNYDNLTASQKKHYNSATSSKQTTYQITVTNPNGNKLSSLSYKIGDSAAVSVELTDGVGEFTLNNGEKAVFEVPADYEVTIIPKPGANTIERFDYNYSVAITNGGATVTDQPQTAVLEKVLAYAFTNTYAMQTTSLTINTNISTKFTDGTQVEKGGTVLYRIKGVSGDLLTENIDLQVAAECNDDGTVDSITINGLPVGKYTVTQEKAWIWRYTLRTFASNVTGPTLAGDKLSFTLPKQNGNYLTFNDEITYNKWVDGNSYVENKFS